MTGDLITRTYGNFRGVDFRGGDVSLQRSPDSLNMWKDYRVDDSVRTRPALTLAFQFDETIHSISRYGDAFMIHSGESLYKVTAEERTEFTHFTLADVPSVAFVYKDVWYLLDGTSYICYDGKDIEAVEGFIPTTSIARNPKGGGTIYQAVNMLSDYRINTFVANGVRVKKQDSEGKEYDANDGDRFYYLDAKWEQGDADIEVYINGERILNNDKDYPWLATTPGVIEFAEDHAPLAPLTDGQANVSIKFKVHVDGYADNVRNCTMAQTFDNRVFISGNKNHPNAIWHSGLHDPTYFPDTSYLEVGFDNTPVTGMVAGNDRLWAFRRPSQENAGVFYYTPMTDEEQGRVYSYQHSSISTGCVGKAINFNDDIVFFSNRGMEGVNVDITREQAIAHRSTMVDAKMLAETKYEAMQLAEFEGYLLVIIGKHVYVADSRSLYTNADHAEYDFFYWELGHEVTAVFEYEGELFLGADNDVYILNGRNYSEERGIGSYWVTGRDKFNAANKVKTTNKKGCVIEADGDIKVSVRTDNGDYEVVHEEMGAEDRFTCRIKKKKWNDIQLKFESASENGFSLTSATLEAYVGRYLK